MTGPKKIGFWSDLKAENIGKQRGFLYNGHKYRVIKDFIDYDGTTHNKGEVWSIPLFLDDMEQQDIDSHPEVYIEVYN